jgi:glycosyltransferase involved in cell wall biosynthesis
MDVYADNLVAGLKAVRPDWEIIEIAPEPWSQAENLWHSGTGLRKYYERFWNHPRTVSRQQADIFHIIDNCNAHVAYWLKQRGQSVVVTCHDLVQFVYPEILKGQARFPAFSMAAWKYSMQGMTEADRIIAVSSNTAQDITQMLGIAPERITVIPNGVESYFRVLPSDRVQAIRQQQGLSNEAFCLLNVGSNHQRKNVFTVLKVLKELKDKGLPVYLWKIGDDFTGEQKEFIEEQDLGNCIAFLGKADKEKLVEYYNAADALIAPSLYEGFGLTILEAMACGTPVVTSNVSSLPEVAGDATILTDPLDVQAIVAAVSHLYGDEIHRQEMIEKGLHRIQQFTWMNATEKVATIYEKIVSQK